MNKNRGLYHYSYVCVPLGKGGFAFDICEKLGLGVLVYRSDMDCVQEIVRPQMIRARGAMMLFRKHVKPHHSNAIPGVRTGADGYVSSFTITVDRLKRYLKRNLGKTMRECIQSFEHHYSSDSVAISSLSKWIQKGKVAGVKKSEKDTT